MQHAIALPVASPVTTACVVAAFVLATSAGCGGSASKGTASKGSQKPAAKEKGHEHGGGPHGGAIADWGGGAYHVEFTVDHDTKQATVYILGHDEKTPSPIKAESIELLIDEPKTELKLVAVPQEKEPAGTSSRFTGKHATLGIVREFSGTIRGVVDGTPYTGNFKEMPH